MPVQKALAVVRGQPRGKKLAARRHVALLEHRVRQAVRGVGVCSPQSHRAFAQSAAGGEVAGFGMRPAEIAQEPPVLAVMRGGAFAYRKLGGVVVGAA